MSSGKMATICLGLNVLTSPVDMKFSFCYALALALVSPQLLPDPTR